MEEKREVQVEEGISLIDILHLLVSRLKLLIVVLLAGCVLGGSFAVFKTYGVYHYGTTVAFHVNPKKEDAVVDSTPVNGTYSASVIDGMIKLLNAEIFTEALLLNNDKVPKKDEWTTAEEEIALKLNEKIDAANVELEKEDAQHAKIEKTTAEKADATIELTKANKEYSNAKKAYEAVNKELESIWYAHYVIYSSKDEDGVQSVFSPSFNETIYEKLIHSEHKDKLSDALKEKYNEWTRARAEKNAKEEDQVLATNAVDDLTDSLETLEKELKDIQVVTNEKVNEALDAWRKTAQYRKELEKYKSSLSFQYLLSTEKIEDAQNLSRNQIFVNISVNSQKEEQKAFAEELVERVKLVVPPFVEKNMPKIAGYSSTSCIRTTRLDEIQRTNPNYMMNSVIKYSLLVGFAALVIACIAVVLLDQSDKCLRDPDVITKRFNLPVLGIIPNLADTEPTQKKTTKKSSKGANS